MRAFCSLLSGGKDSTYALHKALDAGARPVCVAVILPARADSWMFHRPFVEFVHLQLESMGLADRLVKLDVSGVKEVEVDELEEGLARAKERYNFDAIVIGGVASRYQLDRFAKVASRIGAEIFDPQWGADPERYMLELTRYGIVYVITQITTAGLPPRLLGVPIKSEGQVGEVLALARKFGFHPAFEGGEAETFVVQAPRFRRGLCLDVKRVRVSEFEWRLEPLAASLCEKARVTVDGVTYEA